MTVAALYVDPNGVYADVPDVDLWDEARDARRYAGPWPVVAHPPCNRWVAYGSQAQRGHDGGCFAAALDAVRRFGGVLEHPADSQAWRAFDLPRPMLGGWVQTIYSPGAVCEVDQWHYGFATRKRTWLYAVAGTLPALPAGHAGTTRGCDSLHSGHRSATPPAFRDVLLELARSARPAPAAAAPV